MLIDLKDQSLLADCPEGAVIACFLTRGSSHCMKIDQRDQSLLVEILGDRSLHAVCLGTFLQANMPHVSGVFCL